MTGVDEHGFAVPTGVPAIDAALGRGWLQDAENCGYRPSRDDLATLNMDERHGDPLDQFRHGRIVLHDGRALVRREWTGVWRCELEGADDA